MTFKELAEKTIETVDHFMKLNNIIGEGYEQPYLLLAWTNETSLQIIGGNVGRGGEGELNRTRALELFSQQLAWYKLNDPRHRTATILHDKGRFVVALGIYDIGDTGVYLDIALEVMMLHLNELK